MKKGDKIEGGPWDGFEVIDVYTRAQAIEDGILVDLMQDKMEKVCRQFYKYPIACTAGVFEAMETSVKYTRGASFAGILGDMFSMCRLTGRSIDPTTKAFKCKVGRRLLDLKMVCGPGDDAEPVLTLMFIDED